MRTRQIALASLALWCVGCGSWQTRVASMIDRGNLIEACRALNEQTGGDELVAKVLRKANVEVRMQALSGAALRQMLRVDAFAERPAVDYRRRMLLSLQLSYRRDANLRIAIKHQPEMEPCRQYSGFCTNVGKYSPWGITRLERKPTHRFGPRPGLNRKVFSLGGLLDLVVKAGTLGAIDPNLRGSDQTLRQDLGLGRKRQRRETREPPTPPHVQRLRRLIANQCSKSSASAGCSCPPGRPCRVMWYYRKSAPGIAAASTAEIQLWLKIEVVQRGERCTFNRPIQTIYLPGKGTVAQRINALFARGPRPLVALGITPPDGTGQQKTAADAATAARLAKVAEKCRPRCSALGHCHVFGHIYCEARDAASCAASYRGRDFGARLLGKNAKGRPTCVADAQSCRVSNNCRRIGWCGFQPAGEDKRAPTPARCAPTSSEHCAASDACRSNGECALVGTRCRAANATHCSTSRHCREYGWCALSKGRCVAGSRADCKRSRRCRQWGWCRFDASNSDCTFGRL
ncbi:MAG: hypothetical protein KC503_18585 [Myxococcales bacterium]|nr:hypothetical protein [Myxococcales bacterium]